MRWSIGLRLIPVLPHYNMQVILQMCCVSRIYLLWTHTVRSNEFACIVSYHPIFAQSEIEFPCGQFCPTFLSLSLRRDKHSPRLGHPEWPGQNRLRLGYSCSTALNFRCQLNPGGYWPPFPSCLIPQLGELTQFGLWINRDFNLFELQLQI